MNQEEKVKLISVTEMAKLFRCSRNTVYVKYMPLLKRYPTTTNKIMFLYDDVLKLKEKMEEKDYDEVFIKDSEI